MQQSEEGTEAAMTRMARGTGQPQKGGDGRSLGKGGGIRAGCGRHLCVYQVEEVNS